MWRNRLLSEFARTFPRRCLTRRKLVLRKICSFSSALPKSVLLAHCFFSQSYRAEFRRRESSIRHQFFDIRVRFFCCLCNSAVRCRRGFFFSTEFSTRSAGLSTTSFLSGAVSIVGLQVVVKVSPTNVRSNPAAILESAWVCNDVTTTTLPATTTSGPTIPPLTCRSSPIAFAQTASLLIHDNDYGFSVTPTAPIVVGGAAGEVAIRFQMVYVVNLNDTRTVAINMVTNVGKYSAM